MLSGFGPKNRSRAQWFDHNLQQYKKVGLQNAEIELIHQKMASLGRSHKIDKV